MEPNIAVLIDFENIAAGTEKEGLGRTNVGLIMNRLREKGRVLTARSYADWGRFARFKKDMLFESVQLFELSAHGMNDKNRADIAMVVDCMDLAFTKDYIDTYVIVSGDSDFTPLIMKLRELNKRVIGLGTRRSTSRLIVEACDEFIFYDTLRQQKTQRPSRRSDRADTADRTKRLSREDAMELVTEALAALQREDPKAYHASRIKEQILRKEPAFSDADLGFNSFARFMEYCKKQGIVSLRRDSRGGGYLVDTTEEDERTSSEATPNAIQFSDGAGALYDILKGEDYELLSREMRQALCETMMKVIGERAEKSKRVNIQWVTQDSGKLLRSSFPALTARRVKQMVNVLHEQGVFRHSDGEPVRSFFAAFELGVRDAAGLMKLLDVAALKMLQAADIKLKSRVQDLAELLYNDPEKVQVVEELMAWELGDLGGAGAPAAQAPKAAGKPPEQFEEPGEEAPAKKTRRRRNRKATSDEEGAAPDASGDVSKEEAPKKRRAPRKRTTKAAAEVPAKAPAAAEVLAPSDAAPAVEEMAPAKERDVKQAAVKEPAAKKVPVKKPAEKKAPVKKPAAKKPAAKKPAAKKPAAKKPAAKKPAADGEAAPKKSTTTRRRKAPAKKTAEEAPATKPAPRKRTTAVRAKPVAAKAESSES